MASYLEYVRGEVERQYEDHPTGCGGSFGELLCHEMHNNGLTFMGLARKWGLSISTVGDLIADHCKRLEPVPVVTHPDAGSVEDWSPVTGGPHIPCKECGSPEVFYRVETSYDGAYDDTNFKCNGCGRDWWVDGGDA